MDVKFFKQKKEEGGVVFAVQSEYPLSPEAVTKLSYLLSADLLSKKWLKGNFIGPRVGLVTPWSTSAVEIAKKSEVAVIRIEEFLPITEGTVFDPMLKAKYVNLTQKVFTVDKKPDPILYIEDIATYNKKEGLALSDDEITYLENVAKLLERNLTDSEIFGFSQANSDHCRHKVFTANLIIDGEEKEFSLFQLIKRTTKENPNYVVSAYKDNAAAVRAGMMEQFAPEKGDSSSNFQFSTFDGVWTLKAETHNFPTTVEPFNGASTGTGGEIRDREGVGTGSSPLTGTAVYMTAYPRTTPGNPWEENIPERPWLYQTPAQILIKASNGASDFGNKFGQPLINGGLLTFEHKENGRTQAYDKVIMMAGGVGIMKIRDIEKQLPQKDDVIVLLGGDNYRIGMGGGAVSSVSTGEYTNAIELNAVQRANPQMQKRGFNVIRALIEIKAETNPIRTVHDHGAGGHFNCLSELVEGVGGIIYLNRLPVGDPTLSAKEIIGNESQERMGLVIKASDFDRVKAIADRENCPCYLIGKITGDKKFVFEDENTGERPIDMALADIFGNPPKLTITDTTNQHSYEDVIVPMTTEEIKKAVCDVLSLEGVACKDWLTNKVDRSVTGKVALQQTCGEIQLPLNNCGVVKYDYLGVKGIAKSLGMAPAAGLINPKAGSILSIAEALTNIVFAPLTHGLKGVSLSANWMWPVSSPGETARLYAAVKAVSDFAIALRINVPTGKDSNSMTSKYDDQSVDSPGTVIISAAAECSDVRKVVQPVLQKVEGSKLYYINFGQSGFPLGGSAFAQTQGKIGKTSADVVDPEYFKSAFETIQKLVDNGDILAGHDVSSGGLITTLLEMNFANVVGGMQISLGDLVQRSQLAEVLFSENPAIVIQVNKEFSLEKLQGLNCRQIGTYFNKREIAIYSSKGGFALSIDEMRNTWFAPSFRLDALQVANRLAQQRFMNYDKQPLSFLFPSTFDGKMETLGLNPNRRSGIQAAIIREQGSNGDREMAFIMRLAGFDVRDVAMSDLIEGRETLEDVGFIVFVGGFSYSDVLGSAKGWAAAFKYNEKAKQALDNFYARPDTLSLGVCNGCQLMVALGLVGQECNAKMLQNDSRKFESGFVNVIVKQSRAVMLQSLAKSQLGIWVAHGEGNFSLSDDSAVVMKYVYNRYPGNPNGSDYDTAGICTEDGRHLAMMPHPERGTYPTNWAHYPRKRRDDQIAPWILMFLDAKTWLQKNKRR